MVVEGLAEGPVEGGVEVGVGAEVESVLLMLPELSPVEEEEAAGEVVTLMMLAPDGGNTRPD